MNLAAGTSYCFSSRARGTNGLVSAWTAETCINTPIDDRALTAKGTWKKSTSAKAYAHTLRTATKTKVSLRASGASVRRLALLVTKVRNGGAVVVKVGSRVLGTYKLSASSTKNKVLVTLPTLRPATTATITITTKSGKKVVIDGLLVSRK
jgi:hypothetical protein